MWMSHHQIFAVNIQRENVENAAEHLATSHFEGNSRHLFAFCLWAGGFRQKRYLQLLCKRQFVRPLQNIFVRCSGIGTS